MTFDSNEANAHNNRGRVLADQERLDEAIELRCQTDELYWDPIAPFDKASALELGDPPPRRVKANLLFRLGRYEESWKRGCAARQCCEKKPAEIRRLAHNRACGVNQFTHRQRITLQDVRAVIRRTVWMTLWSMPVSPPKADDAIAQ